jgi:hypothetical protein
MGGSKGAECEHIAHKGTGKAKLSAPGAALGLHLSAWARQRGPGGLIPAGPSLRPYPTCEFPPCACRDAQGEYGTNKCKGRVEPSAALSLYWAVRARQRGPQGFTMKKRSTSMSASSVGVGVQGPR